MRMAAVLSLLHWADRELGGPLCCIIDEDNLRSIHLAERFGFTYEHDVIYHGKPVRMFTRPAVR